METQTIATSAPVEPAPLGAGTAAEHSMPTLRCEAVVFDGDRALRLVDLDLKTPGAGDVIVQIELSGISTGTERLLWSSEMPAFPGLAYPLVPGYESVGTVVWSSVPNLQCGERVFVPGSSSFKDAAGLFGGAASTVVVSADRLVPCGDLNPEDAVLLALAATAHHAIDPALPPSLIIGHGVLGRLLARLTVATGAPAPTVWEIRDDRFGGAAGYNVIHPDADETRSYTSICDVSGASGALDRWISKLEKGGRLTLAGFYTDRLSFAFPAAFMKEAQLHIAAEWSPEDMAAVLGLLGDGRLSLGGLVTHRATPDAAVGAYNQAFTDPTCLKMIIDWRNHCD